MISDYHLEQFYPFCKKQRMWAVIWYPVWLQGVSVVTVISPSLFAQVAWTRWWCRNSTLFCIQFQSSAVRNTSYAREELTFVGQKRDTFFVVSGCKQFVMLRTDTSVSINIYSASRAMYGCHYKCWLTRKWKLSLWNFWFVHFMNVCCIQLDNVAFHLQVCLANLNLVSSSG